MSDIRLAPLHRVGDKSLNGVGNAQRYSLDFVIDGLALSKEFQHDLAGCLGWGPIASQAATIDGMMGQVTRGQAHRIALYVCPECGDLECGAVTVTIERTATEIIWRAFAYEQSTRNTTDFATYAHLGPFRFEAQQYEQVLRDTLRRDAAPIDSAP